MLIRYPLRELLDILLDPVMLGVEDVDPVLGCSDAMLIYIVIAVATYMVSLVNNQALGLIISTTTLVSQVLPSALIVY